MRLALSAAVAGAIAAVGLVAVGPGAPSAQAPGIVRAPDVVENFQLTDQTRMAHDLYYFKYAPSVVLMTQTNGAAYSRASAAKLEKLAAAYRERGVLFYMLNSNLSDGREAVAAEAARQGFTIPVLIDEQQLVGESLGVSREGEVFVADPAKGWKLAYRGPVEGAGAAIEAVLGGKPVAEPRVAMTTGKAIAFPERAKAAQFAQISYTRQIAPIIQDKCVSCHLSGGIGPFAFDSYEKVKGFAPMIRETLRTRRMPPYFADPHIGDFKNDQGLAPSQMKTLVHWIEAGAPRGAGADPLKVNEGKVAPEWPTELGKPDVIVDLPSFDVPATGLVDYQNQRVANPFGQDTWLRAVAIKPGDRRAVHHIISNYVADRSKPRSPLPGGSVGSYTPGAEPQVMAPGSGTPVPGGGSLNFQMHYTTFGKPTTDKTQVGFYLLKETPKYIKRSAVIADTGLMIPAGEARHRETAYMTFPADAYLLTLYPHAHYRGMHVELKMKTPDGKETMLLSLPKYDFNWQRDYDPVEPILVKAGTKLIATWVYDNSVHNKANPDSTKDVRWGEQTKDEMMYFRVNYRFADETTDHIRGDLQAKLSSSILIGGMDDNIDGLIQQAEMKGFFTGMKARFAELDKDRNGGLDQTELAGGMPRGFARAFEIPDL